MRTDFDNNSEEYSEDFLNDYTEDYFNNYSEEYTEKYTNEYSESYSENVENYTDSISEDIMRDFSSGTSGDDLLYISDDEYEKRRAARRTHVDEQIKRQLLYRKIFLGGIGVILVVALIIVVISVSLSHRRNAGSQSGTDSKNSADNTDSDILDSSQSEGLNPDDETNNGDGNGDGADAETAGESTDYGIDKKQVYTLSGDDYLFNETTFTETVSFGEFYSQYAVIIRADDGQILAEKDPYSKMYPASMTKVMTVLTAKMFISDDELDDLVTVSQEATDFSYSNDCSAVGFSVGEQVTVRDLFYGTILKSGGDAAYMLATYTAGSHEKFVELMNKNCEALGISDTTHFSNCVGIYTDDNYTTCVDMAKIMAATRTDDFLCELMESKFYTTSFTNEHPEGIEISNLFLRRIVDFSTYGYVAAAKTGFVNQSGNCAVSLMYGDDGNTYICVTGHGSSAWQEVYDHITLYNIYAGGNTSFSSAKELKITN